MHYAVSHGNFDVVSILLDSKVCDINIINDAGYTCVMLVSLAQIKSDTHQDVIRRLFSMADVNLKAKQVITDKMSQSCSGFRPFENFFNLHFPSYASIKFTVQF